MNKWFLVNDIKLAGNCTLLLAEGPVFATVLPNQLHTEYYVDPLFNDIDIPHLMVCDAIPLTLLIT